MRLVEGCSWSASLTSRCACWFFFSSRRRHTRSLCDWSSDVCSSDLLSCPKGHQWEADASVAPGQATRCPICGADGGTSTPGPDNNDASATVLHAASWEIGRASCRERV